MKLSDLMNGNAMETDEVVMEKTMNNLDVTVKQTISKGDEGKSCITLLIHLYVFCLFFTGDCL